MSLIRTQALYNLSRISHPNKQLIPFTTQWARQFSGAEPFVIDANRPRVSYDQAFNESRQKPEEFWGQAAYAVTWYKKWEKLIDNSDPASPKWFAGAKLNTSYNCLDRHVEDGAGEQTALIYHCAYTGQVQTWTYNRLTQRVAKLAGVLARRCGVRYGDRVVIYMPQVPQAIGAMLACARIGAIHSVVFGGFAAKELATRIQHARPKVVITCNCGIEPNRVIDYKPIVDEAIRLSSYKPKFLIMYSRPPGAPLTPKPYNLLTELDYETEIVNAKPHDPIPVDANHPLYLLYTSGTTGNPKGIVRTNGGHLVALTYSMPHIYGIHPNDVWWAASDIGWVVGHSYIVYGPLAAQCTTILYEGKPVGTPDTTAFFRVLSQHGVNSAFFAPTALRSIRREDEKCEFAKDYDLTALREVFVGGEHCGLETLKWAQATFKKPVHEQWWQTESGWPMSSALEDLARKRTTLPGSAGRPVPGFDIRIMNAEGKEAQADELGSIVVKTPLPPGFMTGLWENDQHYRDLCFKKFPRYYDTMDSGKISSDGDLFLLGRTDDVIRVASHRISTSGLEEALVGHDDVVEAAVVGVDDKVKGQVPFGFIVLGREAAEKGAEHAAEVAKNTIDHVRTTVGPVAALKRVVVVKKLPKTRAGKIARNTLAAMADGKPFKIPITIEDPDVYPQIAQNLRDVGIVPRALA